MSSTVAMPVSTQASRGGKPGLAKDISKDLYTSLACSLILDDCSILASVAAESADMIPIFTLPPYQGYGDSAATPLSPSTPLPPPAPSIPARTTAQHLFRFPADMSDAFLNPSRRSRSLMSGEDAVPLSCVSPGPVWPSANQLKVAYTYGIQREDGSYTQLIRADELDRYDFERVRVSQGPEGMIVLPPPEQPRPERREGSELMVPNDIIQTLPVNGVRHPPKDDDTQMQIDSIIAQAALSPVAPELSKPTRREKIYCDKWIHEGVCAFTQLGCKYKHEMPLDKATQLSLGLNHGLPVWYKRAQAVQVRPEPQSTDSPSSARTTGPWRRTTTAAPLPAGQSIGGGMQSSSAGHSSFGSSSFVTAPFGPIGPPIPAQQAQASNNPYSMLSPDTKSDDEEDPTFVWRGRGR